MRHCSRVRGCSARIVRAAAVTPSIRSILSKVSTPSVLAVSATNSIGISPVCFYSQTSLQI
eukprot:2085737-Prorocentrum_lima.AAC.1